MNPSSLTFVADWSLDLCPGQVVMLSHPGQSGQKPVLGEIVQMEADGDGSKQRVSLRILWGEPRLTLSEAFPLAEGQLWAVAREYVLQTAIWPLHFDHDTAGQPLILDGMRLGALSVLTDGGPHRFLPPVLPTMLTFLQRIQQQIPVLIVDPMGTVAQCLAQRGGEGQLAFQPMAMGKDIHFSMVRYGADRLLEETLSHVPLPLRDEASRLLVAQIPQYPSFIPFQGVMDAQHWPESAVKNNLLSILSVIRQLGLFADSPSEAFILEQCLGMSRGIPVIDLSCVPEPWRHRSYSGLLREAIASTSRPAVLVLLHPENYCPDWHQVLMSAVGSRLSVMAWTADDDGLAGVQNRITFCADNRVLLQGTLTGELPLVATLPALGEVGQDVMGDMDSLQIAESPILNVPPAPPDFSSVDNFWYPASRGGAGATVPMPDPSPAIPQAAAAPVEPATVVRETSLDNGVEAIVLPEPEPMMSAFELAESEVLEIPSPDLSMDDDFSLGGEYVEPVGVFMAEADPPDETASLSKQGGQVSGLVVQSAAEAPVFDEGYIEAGEYLPPEDLYLEPLDIKPPGFDEADNVRAPETLSGQWVEVAGDTLPLAGEPLAETWDDLAAPESPNAAVVQPTPVSHPVVPPYLETNSTSVELDPEWKKAAEVQEQAKSEEFAFELAHDPNLDPYIEEMPLPGVNYGNEDLSLNEIPDFNVDEAVMPNILPEEAEAEAHDLAQSLALFGDETEAIRQPSPSALPKEPVYSQPEAFQVEATERVVPSSEISESQLSGNVLEEPVLPAFEQEEPVWEAGPTVPKPTAEAVTRDEEDFHFEFPLSEQTDASVVADGIAPNGESQPHVHTPEAWGEFEAEGQPDLSQSNGVEGTEQNYAEPAVSDYPTFDRSDWFDESMEEPVLEREPSSETQGEAAGAFLENEGSQGGQTVDSTQNIEPGFDFQPGNLVFHPTYGNGQIQHVIPMEGRIILNIQFDKVGKRLMDPALAELELIQG